MKQLGAAIDLLIDSGRTAGEQPSTIIDVTTSPPLMIREGAVPLAKLRCYL